MLLSATAMYVGVLLLVTLAAALGFGLQVRSRRRRDRDFTEEDDAGEEYRDIPLVIQPRNVGPRVPQAPRSAPQKTAPRPAPAVAHASAAIFNAASAPPQPDEPVQLLAGRLEPLNPGVHQEIRFVKTAGVDRFTLGRSSGPLYSHIQLTAPTASRLHAYMRPDKGGWRIGNLSTTNPLLINGARLRTEDGERLLEDGDRIQLGEIIFVFRER